ncbi:hypothetical protein DXG01_014357 [Tephrocybe rancida]|nr:hypothetical protein DXG01_014357 [Tephrocybe rancida]
MLSDAPDPGQSFYLTLGGEEPGISTTLPCMRAQDHTTVVIKVKDAEAARRLENYQDCFKDTSARRQLICKAVADKDDIVGCYYPVVGGTFLGKAVRMIFSDFK